jgi:hypothetical protein
MSWVLLALMVLRVVGTASEREHLQFGREPGAATYPAGAVEYLRSYNLRGNLFNAYDWGGYLIYRLYPERPVFIDGRADVYRDGHVKRYMEVALLRPGWRRVLDEHDVQLVLMQKQSPLAVALADDAEWQQLYEGQVERLFVRGPR